MTTIIIIVFIAGYLAIVFEELLRFNKTATALLTGVLCWTIYALYQHEAVGEELAHHLTSIAEILFFLLGAMVVVELIDAHEGFELITNRISTRNPRALLWIIALLSFFLSALLDNLTTAIVMVALLRKLIKQPTTRKLMAGVVIISANAGGAWSPIGDVTTTMLWIGGQITTLNIIKSLFLPSLVCLLVPILVLSFSKNLKNTLTDAAPRATYVNARVRFERNLMFWIGLGGLLFVPIFKTLTHLPPYMGMLLVLGVIWAASEVIHRHKDTEDRKPFTAAYALSRIDSTSILFFLGILLAIGCLEATHLLQHLAQWLSHTIGNLDAIVLLIGLASAVIDNVPLVAASMGMYDLQTYPTDHRIWEFLAYCAGTGGSILIIGSAAGVAVMGMEHIDFGWYLRRISWLALLGYLAGALVYVLLG
jgi:Na+/H+ antiporter NhaD/arsenite permease-like protein